MLKKHEQLQIHDLLDQNFTPADISKRTGKSLATVYKYKRLGRNLQSPKGSRGNYEVPPQIQPYIDFLDPLIKRPKMKSREIFYEVKGQGYDGSFYLFDKYVSHRKQELKPLRTINHLITEPGEEAQVDWGHWHVINIDGKKQKVYLFAYILSWSRAIYMEFVVRQNQKTLQECHMHAFERLGIPNVILYDNMKTVVKRRVKSADGTKEAVFTPAFLNFAKYYQFTPKACYPYWPQSKGKVERSIQYVRGNFPRLTPKVNITLDELNKQLSKWVDETAQLRIHRETREQPKKLWEDERPFLSFPTNMPTYNPSPLAKRFSSQLGLLTFDSNIYNLGVPYARKKFEIREVQQHGLPHIELYHKDILVCTVEVPSGRHNWVSIDIYNDVAPKEEVVLKKKAEKVTEVKRKLRHDIEVEQRDLSYYSLALIPLGGTNNG